MRGKDTAKSEGCGGRKERDYGREVGTLTEGYAEHFVGVWY